MANVEVINDGDIFASGCEVITNPVNCVGVMGKGLALAFKRSDPQMFAAYKQLCDSGRLRPGRPFLHRRQQTPHVLLFATKDHWRQPSREQWILDGIAAIPAALGFGTYTLALPALGCGEGGLPWARMRPLLLQSLQALPLARVELYAPR